ncbi:MAG: FhaA domain-containing protein [Blastocatellia bacterium]
MAERDMKGADFSSRLEFFVRRLFERIGGAIDFALRRGGGLEGGARADLATLAPLIEQAVEDNLKRENSRVFAPNLIELRYDYETYTRMGAPRREFLQRELDASIYEYIYNRRYATLGEVQVRILYDAFTRGLEIKAGFGQPKPAVIPQNSPEDAIAMARSADATAASRRCKVVLRIEGGSRELRARLASDAEPAGIGRNSANALIIDDPSVSNFHAALTLSSDGAIALADRGSSNGTCVNGVTLEIGGRCVVRDGDRLRFGDVEATLKINEI